MRAPLLGFVSLQHFEDTRSLSRAAAPATLRLQGLVTLVAFCSPRVPAGLVSYRRRSWDSPFEAFPSSRVSRRSRREGPTCRFPGCLSHRTRGPAGEATRRDFWALTPGQVPCRCARPKAGTRPAAPLGFCPSRGLSPATLKRLLTVSSLTCLVSRILVPLTARTSEHRSAADQVPPRGTNHPS
jgi:hypothetical protein